LDIGSRI